MVLSQSRWACLKAAEWLKWTETNCVCGMVSVSVSAPSVSTRLSPHSLPLAFSYEFCRQKENSSLSICWAERNSALSMVISCLCWLRQPVLKQLPSILISWWCQPFLPTAELLGRKKRCDAYTFAFTKSTKTRKWLNEASTGKSCTAAWWNCCCKDALQCRFKLRWTTQKCQMVKFFGGSFCVCLSVCLFVVVLAVVSWKKLSSQQKN